VILYFPQLINVTREFILGSDTNFTVLKWWILRKHATLIKVILFTYLLTNLLTPWSRVLLEKLTGSAASQEIPRIFGARRFIAVFTSARYLSLSSANSIQSPQPPPTSWRTILVWVSPLVSFPQVSSPEPCAHLSTPPYAQHAPPILFCSILPPAQYWVRSTNR
jgi:hypothetical protein